VSINHALKAVREHVKNAHREVTGKNPYVERELDTALGILGDLIREDDEDAD
jgi:hypothetical protein